MAEMRTGGGTVQTERIPCTLLRTDALPEFHEASSPTAESASICTAAWAGKLGSRLLAACKEDAWFQQDNLYF